MRPEFFQRRHRRIGHPLALFTGEERLVHPAARIRGRTPEASQAQSPKAHSPIPVDGRRRRNGCSPADPGHRVPVAFHYVRGKVP